ncbi:MAG TPA: hypothetical protein DC046_08875 [Rhodospirillaceae bacterium]|nr:hypothetical protein [Rhodospirillaceae bacterium]
MTTSMNVSRRAFMAGAGAAGLILGFRVPLSSGGGAALAGAGQMDEITAWVVVRPDEAVVIRIARSEMGQGTLTGLAQLVAEELDADAAQVTTEFAPANAALYANTLLGVQGTGGQGQRGNQGKTGTVLSDHGVAPRRSRVTDKGCIVHHPLARGG